MNNIKSFKGEFEGLNAWLNTEQDSQKQVRHFASLQHNLPAMTYRTVSLTEAQLRDPTQAASIFKTQTLNESTGLNSEGKFVNDWEAGFFSSRSRNLSQSLTHSEQLLDDARSQAVAAIEGSREVQAEAGLHDAVKRLEGLLHGLSKALQESTDQEEPESSELPKDKPPEDNSAQSLEPEAGEELEEELDFNLEKRFSDIEDPTMLATELLQLIADLGDKIPQVRSVATKLLELL